MSEFHVEVVRVTNVKKHPNADTLSVADAGGYPVVFKTGDYTEGQLAVHVPVDAIVPNTEQWSFLKGKTRIRACRLRGVFSMGLLAPAQPEWVLGQNVQSEMGIEKWEPIVELPRERSVQPKPRRKKWLLQRLWYRLFPRPEDQIPKYTDIESYRRNRNALVEGEEVVLTEKIHGANGRWCWYKGRLWVGSHTYLRYDDHNDWAEVAHTYHLADKLKRHPGIVIFGEVFGDVQDLKYGAKKGELRLVLFDAYSIKKKRYLDYDDFVALAADIGVPIAPELFRGPWDTELLALAEGPSTVVGALHMREGFVVRPVKERVVRGLGRIILKMVGEGYWTR